MSTCAIEIEDRASGKFVPATLHSEMTADEFVLVERAWAQERASLLAKLRSAHLPPSRRPQSLHWDWSKKAPLLQELGVTGYGIECFGLWQGLMLVSAAEHESKLAADAGKPLVYVDFIESAPWNWKYEEIGQFPIYKGIGVQLFREAVRESVSEGFQGRVGLHSLGQSESFYQEVCKMTRVGEDPRYQDLVYYELSREQAKTYWLLGEKR